MPATSASTANTIGGSPSATMPASPYSTRKIARMSKPRLRCSRTAIVPPEVTGRANGRPALNGTVVATPPDVLRVSIAIASLLATSVLPHPTRGSGIPSSAAADSAAAAGVGSDYRASVIARAKVWRPTHVPGMDLKAGPAEPKPFAPLESVTCTYVKEQLNGKTPKFACMHDEKDQLKVKFGGDNGEVYAEVMASRLLWALGFGADHMYSVRVVCRNCPSLFNGVIRSASESIFDPAAVERKMPGDSFEPDEGWSWNELDLIDEKAGGATRAQRDALKLLAVFIQHTDTKPEQDRKSVV